MTDHGHASTRIDAPGWPDLERQVVMSMVGAGFDECEPCESAATRIVAANPAMLACAVDIAVAAIAAAGIPLQLVFSEHSRLHPLWSDIIAAAALTGGTIPAGLDHDPMRQRADRMTAAATLTAMVAAAADGHVRTVGLTVAEQACRVIVAAQRQLLSAASIADDPADAGPSVQPVMMHIEAMRPSDPPDAWADRPEHLRPIRSPRGFYVMPRLPGRGGDVVVLESSNAAAPELLLMCVDQPGRPAALLTVDVARQLAEQLTFLAEHHYQMS